MAIEINDFLRKVEGEFEDIDAGSLTLEFNFRESKEWSSMHALIIIALIDVEYEVTIGGEDLMQMQTLQDIYNFVLEKQQHA